MLTYQILYQLSHPSVSLRTLKGTQKLVLCEGSWVGWSDPALQVSLLLGPWEEGQESLGDAGLLALRTKPLPDTRQCKECGSSRQKEEQAVSLKTSRRQPWDTMTLSQGAWWPPSESQDCKSTKLHHFKEERWQFVAAARGEFYSCGQLGRKDHANVFICVFPSSPSQSFNVLPFRFQLKCF